MLHLIVLAVALTACVADEEAQASASADPIVIHNDYLYQTEQQRLRDGVNRLRGDLYSQRNIHLHRDDSHRDDRHRDDRHREDRHRDDRHRDDRHHDDRHRDDRHRDDRHGDDHHRGDGDRGSGRRDDYHYDEEPLGPVILRSIRPHEHGQKPDIARQNKIIADVYSPDYAEPTWVLDYRYLKTGGRDYTRGPGGQILILPKGIHTNEHKEFKNYDEMIEHLRLKNLAERSKPQYFMPLGEGAKDDDHDDREDHRIPLRHNDRDWWKRN